MKGLSYRSIVRVKGGGGGGGGGGGDPEFGVHQMRT